ncbi:hypothetical protein [Coleofasciculus sp.]|uniref:hypothetical protein n=1 Tax=Coleofasciculus sp. TaxID=3100458 RepID=UPI003A22C78A
MSAPSLYWTLILLDPIAGCKREVKSNLVAIMASIVMINFALLNSFSRVFQKHTGRRLSGIIFSAIATQVNYRIFLPIRSNVVPSYY